MIFIGTVTDKQSAFSSIEKQAIVVKNGSFAANINDLPILYDVDIQIPLLSLTVVIGKVGSGKSILLRGLLGEIYNLSGSVYTSTNQVAYCGQEPWLINASIKDNILAGSLLDETWYNTVLTACALDYDIAKFPQHDR